MSRGLYSIFKGTQSRATTTFKKYIKFNKGQFYMHDQLLKKPFLRVSLPSFVVNIIHCYLPVTT